MNSIIKVSIGLPVRNGGKDIRRALEILLAQTEQDFEIIISDNKSNDGSSEYLKTMSESDRRITYVCQDPPISVYDNFRYVLRQARGKYFMWVAHDDMRDINYIECLVNGLENNPESILAFGELNIITPEDKIGHIVKFPFQTTGLGLFQRLVKVYRMQCFHIYGLWKTEAIRRVPYAYCSWWPDLPMMLSAAILGTFLFSKGTRFHYLEKPKSNLERVKEQDYAKKFNLVFAVVELVRATYIACSKTGGVLTGIFCSLLVIYKQLVNLPGFIYRRFKRFVSL